ncbi:MAG: serine hydrolase [Cyanobacteria bacterium J06639_1]
MEATRDTSPDLQQRVDSALAMLVDRFEFDPEAIALALVDLEPKPSVWAHHQGDRLFYPASIIKLFYGAAVRVWESAGKLTVTPEIERALRDAIVDSSNDATSLLVDVLTGTHSGPELSGIAYEHWQERRHVVTRYFNHIGIPGNFCQKTWSDGPYGRDRQSYGANNENRNALTANSTAWLIHSLAAGQVVSPQRSRQLLQLMHRDLDPTTYCDDPLNQIQGFLGEGTPRTARFWSKAGETSFARHDSAMIQLPGRAPYIAVAFGNGPEFYTNKVWLPELSRFWAAQFAATASEETALAASHVAV